MKRPVYDLSTPAGAKAVYEYQLAYRPYRRFTRATYWGFDAVMRPEITCHEGTQSRLAQLSADDAPMLLTLNHLSDLHDQSTGAAIAHQILPQKVGDIRVVAKDGFYNKKLLSKLHVPTLLQPLVTGFVNQMGTIPAARKKDHEDASLAATSELFFDTVNTFTQTGRPTAIYVEGTHNYQHPEINLPVQRGIGQIALRSLEPGNTPVSIVPIGVSYGRDYCDIGDGLAKPNRIRHASVHIGQIAMVEQGMSAEDIVELTAENLQEATTRAFVHYDERSTT